MQTPHATTRKRHHAAIVCGAVIALALTLTMIGCAEPGGSSGQTLNVEGGEIPDEARVVARSESPRKGMMFLAPADGRMYFECEGQLAAAFTVNRADRVRLNTPAFGEQQRGPQTRILVGDQQVYTDNDRCRQTRFYFLAEGQDESAGAQPQ